MKIFDCTTFYSEDLMMDIRFNVLNEKVDKFIVVESKYSHSGKEKKLNFDINNYKKFGVVLIKNIISKKWIETLAKGIEKNFKNPSQYKCVNEPVSYTHLTLPTI